MERAIAIDTASGSPSGIATIIKTIAMIAILTSLISVLADIKLASSLIIMSRSKNIADVRIDISVTRTAYLEICFAVFSSLSSRKVWLS